MYRTHTHTHTHKYSQRLGALNINLEKTVMEGVGGKEKKFR